jgi:hypothetical protein
MSLRLWALALWGTSALLADVCGGLPTGPTSGDGGTFPFRPLTGDTPLQRSYRLSVREGGPAFRITIRPLSVEGFSDTLVHAGDIEVARCRDGKQVQSLPFMAWQPLNFGGTFEVRDINFDGYLDFSILTDYAAKFQSRSYWVYHTKSGLFVPNELTRVLGENCLGAAWHGGCWKAHAIEFHPQQREISTSYVVGVGQCSLGGDRYRVEGERLIAVHTEVLDMKPDSCSLTVSDLVDGKMRVTGIRRFDAEGRPLH